MSRRQPIATSVAELQGLYGPFTFPERLLQKIWQRGEFNRGALIAADGRRVTVLHPGRWNRLGGPDFREARMRLADGPELVGDVEVHLHAEDWGAHGHGRDRAFNDVILHVVLFPPRGRRATLTASGREVPVVALLPLLHRGLEEIAGDDAIETLAGGAAGGLSDERREPVDRTELSERGEGRWRAKVRGARLRLQRLGWEEACHHAALEVLGYRFNRVPMLRLAGRHPLAEWSAGGVDAGAAFGEERDRWNLYGLRPANHPRQRLAAYSAWARARPAWPECVSDWARRMPSVIAELPTGPVRRASGFARLRHLLSWSIRGMPPGGSRFDTLVCDGFLPLMAARTSSLEADGQLFQAWFHWFAGDQPRAITQELRSRGICASRDQPLCQGLAQGFLSWLTDRP